MVTKREAAQVLRVSIRTVDRYIASGSLVAVRISARTTRITRASIESLIEPSALKASA